MKLILSIIFWINIYLPNLFFPEGKNINKVIPLPNILLWKNIFLSLLNFYITNSQMEREGMFFHFFMSIIIWTLLVENLVWSVSKWEKMWLSFLLLSASSKTPCLVLMSGLALVMDHSNLPVSYFSIVPGAASSYWLWQLAVILQ